MTFAGLDHDGLVDGLRELIARARDAGLRGASIQIVGGAALKLAYFERAITVDVDALIQPSTDILAISESIALERGWPIKWLNDEADRAGLLPGWGRSVQWTTLYLDDSISIEVASADALLAMKLRAFEKRGRRDLGDVLGLLAIVRPESADQVDVIYEEFYPGDALMQSTMDFLAETISHGLPATPEKSPTPFSAS